MLITFIIMIIVITIGVVADHVLENTTTGV